MFVYSWLHSCFSDELHNNYLRIAGSGDSAGPRTHLPYINDLEPTLSTTFPHLTQLIMRDYSDELARAQALMDELLAHVRAFDPRRLSFVPAVIETASYTLWRGEDAQGFRKYVDGIEHHGALLRAVSEIWAGLTVAE